MADRDSERPSLEETHGQVADRRLIVRADPLNQETRGRALADDVTATAAHFVRSHFATPRLDPKTHRIPVAGAVGAPMSLSLAELMVMPRRTLAVTLECAGNGRLGMAPLPPGEPWGHGAVSTAAWTGVPLREVLHQAGLRDDASEILTVGADAGKPEGQTDEMRFARALPIDKALDPDTLLAFEMNGEPLPPSHGAPVRLVVPGWYGVASVKWLARLEALTRPFGGFFQRERYVYTDGTSADTPVGAMRVRSLVTSPAPGAIVSRGRVPIVGRAWSGEGGVASVEVAVDGGDSWQPAELLRGDAPHAWCRFRLEVTIDRPGRHVIRARARDAAGHVQPDVAPWNRLGYGNNAILPVVIHVV